ARIISSGRPCCIFISPKSGRKRKRRRDGTFFNRRKINSARRTALMQLLQSSGFTGRTPGVAPQNPERGNTGLNDAIPLGLRKGNPPTPYSTASFFAAGNLVSGADFIESFAEWLACTLFHFIQAPLDAANGVEHVLIGGGILNNQFRLAVDGEHFRTSGAFEAAQVRLGVALKIRQRTDVFHGDHSR